MFFRSEAEQAFNVDAIESPIMDTVIKKSAAVYSGEPPWKDVKNGIRTINFAKSLSSETARLATLSSEMLSFRRSADSFQLYLIVSR